MAAEQLSVACGIWGWSAQQATEEARTAANGGSGKTLQFRFELVRYIQLVTMTANLVRAARSADTAAPRVATASQQCAKALQLAELIPSGDLERPPAAEEDQAEEE